MIFLAYINKKERSVLTTNEKIAALRAAAKAAGADGVLLMTSDPHCSEYLPDYYNALPWFSGFTGEISTLVVNQHTSALWCDGRFYVQADKQLAGTEIQCMHAGSAGVPTVAEYLTANFTAGETLLLDGSCAPATCPAPRWPWLTPWSPVRPALCFWPTAV